MILFHNLLTCHRDAAAISSPSFKRTGNGNHWAIRIGLAQYNVTFIKMAAKNRLVYSLIPKQYMIRFCLF